MHRHRLLISMCAVFFIIVGAVFSTASMLPLDICYKKSRIDVSSKFPVTSDRVLSSVLILDGKNQGSGTIISKGKTYSLLLTVAHIFNGKIKGDFWIYFPDGSYTQASLLIVDNGRDLALAAVKSEDILSHSYVPSTITADIKEMTGIGYTESKGPHVKDLSFKGSFYNEQKRFIWEMAVVNGPLWNGDSGGGLFVNEALIGIINQRDNIVQIADNSYAKKLYAISHFEIISFLEANKLDKLEYGDYTIPPPENKDSAVPPIWRPTPNVPIFVKSFRDKEIQVLKNELKSIQIQIDDLRKEKTKVEISSDNIIENIHSKNLLKKPSDINEQLDR